MFRNYARKIFFLFVIAMTLLSLSACDLFAKKQEETPEEEQEEEVCDHEWSKQQDKGKSSTCAVAGYDAYVCKLCGAVKQEPLPLSTDHVYINNVCSVCGKHADPVSSYKSGKVGIELYYLSSRSSVSGEKDYTVIISGSGAMENKVPWKADTIARIRSVTVSGKDIGLCDGLFDGADVLETFEVTGSVASVGKNTFRGCSALTEITFGTGLRSVGSGAFADCRQLAEVTLPGTVTEMGKNAFSGCDILQVLVLPFVGTEDRTGKDACFGSLFTECATAPEDGGQIYYGEETVYFDIPVHLSTVTVLGGDIPEYAFAYYLPTLRVRFGVSVTAIAPYAFYRASGIVSAVFDDIENSVLTDIGEHAFDEATSLEYFALPAGVTELKEGSFLKCSSLAVFEFTSDRLERVGGQAFYHCTSLQALFLPSSVTFIGTQAFTGCGALGVLYLSKDLLVPAKDTFAGCTKLNEVYMTGQTIAGDQTNESQLLGVNTDVYLAVGISPNINGYLYKNYKKQSDITVTVNGTEFYLWMRK